MNYEQEKMIKGKAVKVRAAIVCNMTVAKAYSAWHDYHTNNGKSVYGDIKTRVTDVCKNGVQSIKVVSYKPTDSNDTGYNLYTAMCVAIAEAANRYLTAEGFVWVAHDERNSQDVYQLKA